MGTFVNLERAICFQLRQRVIPEIHFSESTCQIEDFNPKSIRIGEIVRKVYNVNNLKIP